jgi:hypothetical protein
MLRSPYAGADLQSLAGWCDHFDLPSAVLTELNKLGVEKVKHLRCVYESEEYLAMIKEVCLPAHFSRFMSARVVTSDLAQTLYSHSLQFRDLLLLPPQLLPCRLWCPGA